MKSKARPIVFDVFDATSPTRPFRETFQREPLGQVVANSLEEAKEQRGSLATLPMAKYGYVFRPRAN